MKSGSGIVGNGEITGAEKVENARNAGRRFISSGHPEVIHEKGNLLFPVSLAVVSAYLAVKPGCGAFS